MSPLQKTTLRNIIGDTSSKPVIAEIDAIAQAVRARHEASVLAILGYGSCLRGEHVKDTLVDLYVLVEDYKTIHKNVFSRIGNWLLPPNVYYQECSFNQQIIRCKYATITLEQFHKKVSTSTQNPYFWARFCQPTVVIFARNGNVRKSVVEALLSAVETTLSEAETLMPASEAHIAWTNILSHTYGTELRSERSSRAAQIVKTNRSYFEALYEAFKAEPTTPHHSISDHSGWRIRQVIGKTLSVLRLIKAAFTFAGGADYLAWKITRHSGIEVNLTAWQRRHPILTAPTLFWQLYKKGAFR